MLKQIERLACALDGPIPGRASAALAELFERERVQARQAGQGVTLVYAGTEAWCAVTVFGGEAHGLLLHRPDIPFDVFLEDLKDFRLGWLPTEVVRKQGGWGAVFSGEMPAAAEGFVTTFVVGDMASLFTGQGILMPWPMDISHRR